MRIYLVVLGLLLASNAVRAQYKHLLHKPYSKRYLPLDTAYYAAKVLQQDSVPFFSEIRKLENAAKLANALDKKKELPVRKLFFLIK